MLDKKKRCWKGGRRKNKIGYVLRKKKEEIRK